MFIFFYKVQTYKLDAPSDDAGDPQVVLGGGIPTQGSVRLDHRQTTVLLTVRHVVLAHLAIN